MTGHWKHMAMCSPMIVVGIILLAGGANALVAILPVVGCIAMMGGMMWMMGHAGRHRHGGS